MRRNAVALALATAMCLLMPMQGFGSTGGPVPAGKAQTAKDVARADARHALAVELLAVARGKGSTAKFSADVNAFIAKWGPAAGFSQPISSTSGSPVGATQQISTAGSPPSLLHLSVTQYPEQSPSQFCQAGYTCYCGPSAAETVLAYLNPTSYDTIHGKASGETLTNSGWNPTYYYGQWGLAGGFGSGSPYSWKYLETNAPHGSTPGGETPWFSGSGDYPMPQSFNYWMSGAYQGYPYYAPYKPTSTTDYESELVADVYNEGATKGWPLAADVDEVINGLHLPGHPSNLYILHWIALFGYTSYGAGTDFVDPVYGSALNWNVSAYNYGYSSSNIYTLVTTFPFGIVW